MAAETSYMMKLFNDAQQSASTFFSSYFLGVPLLSKGGFMSWIDGKRWGWVSRVLILNI